MRKGVKSIRIKKYLKNYNGIQSIEQVIIYPQWRNWLARSAVNRKAIGSSPIWGV
jgi:hypothetical protein